jgi:hypothetical protein
MEVGALRDAWDIGSMAVRQQWHTDIENRVFIEWAQFEEIRAEIRKEQARSRSGRVTLDAALVDRLQNALFRAEQLAEGWAFGEALQARFNHALEALSETVDGKRRARMFLNRMLGRPDRCAARGREYGRDPLRVVQAYLDLTLYVEDDMGNRVSRRSRPTFDASGGVDWRDRGIATPVDPVRALELVRKEFGLPSIDACRKYLARCGVPGLPQLARDK